MTEQLKEIDAQTARRWLNADAAVLIDIREGDEFAREHIPGAHHVPLSGFDAADFPRDHEKIAVFLCASGNRTREAAPRIGSTLFSCSSLLPVQSENRVAHQAA